MGTLKANTAYIYERANGITYARESGADPNTRQIVGYDHRTSDGRPLHEHIQEDKLWGEIRRLAKTNEVLQSELERVIMLYNLIKQETKVKHHPV